MDPYELDIQANTKVMTERPSTWIKRPICSTYRDLLARSATMDFMHHLIKTSAKRRAEKCQLQVNLTMVWVELVCMVWFFYWANSIWVKTG